MYVHSLASFQSTCQAYLFLSSMSYFTSNFRGLILPLKIHSSTMVDLV